MKNIRQKWRKLESIYKELDAINEIGKPYKKRVDFRVLTSTGIEEIEESQMEMTNTQMVGDKSQSSVAAKQTQGTGSDDLDIEPSSN